MFFFGGGGQEKNLNISGEKLECFKGVGKGDSGTGTVGFPIKISLICGVCVVIWCVTLLSKVPLSAHIHKSLIQWGN